MKKIIAMLLAAALLAALAVPALAADESPYNACRGNSACPMRCFSDLPGSTWYHDGVHFCLDEGLMTGLTREDDSVFAPEAAVTRAELIVTLYRYAVNAGLDVSAGENTNILSYDDAFDVPQGAFEAFQWATAVDILEEGSTELLPNLELTREALIVMLYRFAQWAGMDVSVWQDTNILSFDDAFDISEGCYEPFQWAFGAGVLYGTSASTIAPHKFATRVQLAAIMLRLHNVRLAQAAEI
ncbi:MAG: S-layer homology domain-containing protein [Ruminococcaceae bacterium]|nr:S-layer homology domain-containing protein [Oscillospiraceae bacterium]